MHRLALSFALLLATLFALPIRPAEAQNARSWVASTGSGTACTRAAPCATFAAAYNATNAGGEINCVDQGDFANGANRLTITSSITIDCEGVQGRFAYTGSSIAIYVNASATDVLTLRGLDIDGNGVAGAGVYFLTGGILHVEKCVIRNFAANGITRVTLNRVEARNNFFGIKADSTLGNASGGVINMTVRDSVSAGNQSNGIVATGNASGPAIIMMVEHSTSSQNATAGFGVIADGPKTTIALSKSTVMGNINGIGASNGGQLVSYGNNNVTLNSTDGTPTSIILAK